MAVNSSSPMRGRDSFSMSSDLDGKFYQVIHSVPITKQEKELKSVVWVAEKVMALAPDIFSKIPITEIVLVDESHSSNPAWSVPGKNVIFWNSTYMMENNCPIDLQVFWLILEKMNILSAEELKRANDDVLFEGSSKENYVRQIERLEHRNALVAQKLVFRAAKEGLIESNRESFVAQSFETYFMKQQFLGHSDIISQAYDQLCEDNQIQTTAFNGTFPLSSSSLDDKTAEAIDLLLKLKILQEKDPNGSRSRSLIPFMINMYQQNSDLNQVHVRKAVNILFPNSP